jgi:hypothetical protein
VGLPDVVAPPTFTVVSAHHEPSGRNANTRALERLGISSEHVLLGSCEWSHTGPLVAGQVLTGTSMIEHVDTRTGGRAGPMDRIRVVTEFIDRATGKERVRFTATLLHVPGMFSGGADEKNPSLATEMPKVGYGQTLGDVTRTGIVRYAGASGDFNPVHHDELHARSLGLPGVFAMGLYPGGVAASQLQLDSGSSWLRHLTLRFRTRVWPGDIPHLIVDGPAPDGAAAFTVLVDGVPVIDGTVVAGAFAAGGRR